MTIQLCPHFGFVIRKEALERQAITRDVLLATMEAQKPFDEDDNLIEFDPHVDNAVYTFITQLEQLGLNYGDDFFDFADHVPDWCTLQVTANAHQHHEQ